MQKLSLWLVFIVMLTSCLETPNNYAKLPPGKWRVVLKLTEPDQVDSSTPAAETEGMNDYFKLPFNLDVVYDENNKMDVYIINGEERIKVESVNYGRDPRTAKDTLQFGFIAFDSTLDGFYEDNIIEGSWKVPNRNKDYKIKFIAYYGESHRFDIPQVKSTSDFSGKWKVTFEYDNDNQYPAIGEFVQDGNKLSGTFITETGDYRYLDGNAYADKMKLSVFDGAHAFLFSGKINNDTIYGEFRSGKHYKSKWKAVRDDAFELTNPYQMTKAVSNEKVDFSFVSSANKKVSINDSEYEGKYKLINIMGTWCPNCRDEINFLKEVQKYNKDIAIISLAFEKYRDEKKAFSVLQKYKQEMAFNWPILLGGYADKEETSEAFSFLDKIYSYPTLLLIDDKNYIVDIHTGFYGPATSQYSTFRKDFFEKLKSLNL
jgi:thiol-disulfide isomerase/thioredoxin